MGDVGQELTPFSDIRSQDRGPIDNFFKKALTFKNPNQELPFATGDYVNAVVTLALQHAEEMRPEIVDLINTVHRLNPQGERFVYDPVHDGALVVGPDDQISTLVDAEIGTLTKASHLGQAGDRYIKDYNYRLKLTGSNTGQTTLNTVQNELATGPADIDKIDQLLSGTDWRSRGVSEPIVTNAVNQAALSICKSIEATEESEIAIVQHGLTSLLNLVNQIRRKDGVILSGPNQAILLGDGSSLSPLLSQKKRVIINSITAEDFFDVFKTILNKRQSIKPKIINNPATQERQLTINSQHIEWTMPFSLVAGIQNQKNRYVVNSLRKGSKAYLVFSEDEIRILNVSEYQTDDGSEKLIGILPYTEAALGLS